MQYFTTSLLEEIKNEYRNLCKQFHPDLVQDIAEKARRTPIMQAINAEYAILSAAARRNEEPARRKEQSRPEPTETDYANMAGVDEYIRQAIEKVIRFEFLSIEICGQWVWIGGTQKRGISAENDACLNILKETGYKWSGAKKLWYFAGVPAGWHKGQWDMNHIRAAYGSQKVKNEKEKEKTAYALA